MPLRQPQIADKETVLKMMREFEQADSAHDGSFWEPEDFVYEDWLDSNAQMEMGLNIPVTWVPSIQLVAFDEKEEALGFVSLRLRLNQQLKEKGGHIGYSVRPSQRGKGYAKAMLAEAVQIAQNKGIKDILVTCHSDNKASRAVILANGGQLEDIRHQTERYWIT
ncbi:GNAT family N-acetyltransferase [Streptococcus ictaluri]|uniref:Acetyltransferase, GNAT family n=1 Tax=Streptococcus ictaluri 707-05 TaxID=764299 RepID=G5K0T6_9STRE|nr:GNAT family N-acetyltransferase [Streptococcus ictaluri]EHI70540.1 acetyltransferase, GNAT family [Streptococcus ictaluri 707-05]